MFSFPRNRQGIVIHLSAVPVVEAENGVENVVPRQHTSSSLFESTVFFHKQQSLNRSTNKCIFLCFIYIGLFIFVYDHRYIMANNADSMDS